MRVPGRPGARKSDDEHPLPTQDRVRRDDRLNLSEYLSAQDLAFDRQASPLVIVELDPFPAMRLPQDLVLGAQVLDDLLLRPIDPPGQNKIDCGRPYAS